MLYLLLGDKMKWYVILSLLFVGKSTLIYSIINYKQEKKLGLKHRYGIFIFSVLLLIIAIGYIFIFLLSIPNPTY
jgi:hypothetical protein